MTRSEALFDEYCRRQGYGVRIIPAGPDRGKTPDRAVRTPSGIVIVEVKELTANDEDMRNFRELKDTGITGGTNRLGARLFNKIHDAASQLRRFSNRGRPIVLVVFDNIEIDGLRVLPASAHLNSAFVDVGMYGAHTVSFVRDPADPQAQWVAGRDARGGRRQLTDSERTYVSAVAVLLSLPEQCLHVYHNYFADTPLPVGTFRGPSDRHFRKPVHPGELLYGWEEVSV